MLGDPPGWSVEASTVDQLGIVTYQAHRLRVRQGRADLLRPATTLQIAVLNPDAIAVNIGGLMSSIGYEYGVDSLGDLPEHRTRLGYDIDHDFATATADLSALLTPVGTPSDAVRR